MIRTSITLPEPLHQRLILASRTTGTAISDLIRNAVDNALSAKEEKSVARSYKILDRMIGMYTDDDPNLASTINETLYGENDAWRGTHED